MKQSCQILKLYAFVLSTHRCLLWRVVHSSCRSWCPLCKQKSGMCDPTHMCDVLLLFLKCKHIELMPVGITEYARVHAFVFKRFTDFYPPPAALTLSTIASTSSRLSTCVARTTSAVVTVSATSRLADSLKNLL